MDSATLRTHTPSVSAPSAQGTPLISFTPAEVQPPGTHTTTTTSTSTPGLFHSVMSASSTPLSSAAAPAHTARDVMATTPPPAVGTLQALLDFTPQHQTVTTPISTSTSTSTTSSGINPLRLAELAGTPEAESLSPARAVSSPWISSPLEIDRALQMMRCVYVDVC